MLSGNASAAGSSDGGRIRLSKPGGAEITGALNPGGAETTGPTKPGGRVKTGMSRASGTERDTIT